MGNETRIAVLIADDEDLFRAALEAVLGAEVGIEVVGRAADGEEAVELAVELRPDVVLMDLSMPGVDGFEATRRILAEREDACVLVLTGSADARDIERAQAAGATAYVTKDRISTDLVAAIASAASDCASR